MGMTVFPDPAEMTLIPLAPYIGLFKVPAAEMTLTPLTPSATWEIPEDPRTQRIFRCVLTGAADGLDDIELPLASFSANVREGDPTYLSCVIPNGSLHEAEILARPNGEIVVYTGIRLPSGEEQLVELITVDLETTPMERTGLSDIITIVGHRTVTTGASKYWPVSGISYFSKDSEGKRRIRAEVDFFLRPGDICQFDGDEMTVGMISYTVRAKPAQAVMEVVEA